MRLSHFLLLSLIALPAVGRSQELSGDPEPIPAQLPATTVSAELLGQARLLLSAYHVLPTREQLEAALGADAQASLWAIVNSESEFALHRDRALVALAQWPDEQLRIYLDTVLATAGEDDMDRHRAISVYARAFGDASLGVIAPLLSESSLQVRLTAIDAVETIGTPAAQAALQSVRGLQAEPLVVERLEQALQALERVQP